MPYEDKKAAPQRRPHAVTLDERSHLTVTADALQADAIAAATTVAVTVVD